MLLIHLSPHSTWNTLHHGTQSHLHKLDQYRAHSHMTVFADYHAVVHSRTRADEHPVTHVPSVAQYMFTDNDPITYYHVVVAMHNRFFQDTGLFSDGDLPRICPDHRPRPNAGPFSNLNISYYIRIFADKGSGVDLRPNAIQPSNQSIPSFQIFTTLHNRCRVGNFPFDVLRANGHLRYLGAKPIYSRLSHKAQSNFRSRA